MCEFNFCPIRRIPSCFNPASFSLNPQQPNGGTMTDEEQNVAMAIANSLVTIQEEQERMAMANNLDDMRAIQYQGQMAAKVQRT